MSSLAQPIPQRTYIFVANKAAVGDQVNKELDTLYGTLQGGLGDAHFASNANLNGAKIASGSIPSTAFADPNLQAGVAFVPIGAVLDYWSDGTVPTGYQVCDGSAITDSGSPLAGKTIPNLTAAFTRGVPLSNLRGTPVNGGEDTHVLTVNELASHGHTVNDPGHGHGVSDGGHNHGVNDPGHAHNATYGVQLGGTGGYYAAQTGHFNDRPTSSATTGINLNGSNANITVNGGGTNIGIASTGGGAAHNNIPAYVGMVKIMRIK